MSILDLDPSMSAEDINLLVGEGMRSKELDLPFWKVVKIGLSELHVSQ